MLYKVEHMLLLEVDITMVAVKEEEELIFSLIKTKMEKVVLQEFVERHLIIGISPKYNAINANDLDILRQNVDPSCNVIKMSKLMLLK